MVYQNGTSYSPKFAVSSENVFSELNMHMLADGYNLVLDLSKSSGSSFIDKRNGKKYLDFFTCFASMPIGWNHPKMSDPGFINYIGRLALNKPSNSDIYTEEMASFVKTFFNIAVPDYFKYSFFVEGGALAVENALKTAIDWKVRQNMRNGHPDTLGTKIIHFRQAFHGRSGYTMSLTNTDPNKVKLFPKFDWPRVSNPKLTFPLTEENLSKTIEAEKISIAEIKKVFADNPNDIAGIIIEPIQAEGGDNHFRTEFLAELRRLADENEALLIFDEVQTGVGITGTMWAHEQLGVRPDIMTFGKKMQVCGILATDRVDKEPDNCFKVSSRINSTWGGNLLDMVRATKYLEIISEEDLIGNARNVGADLLGRLKSLTEARPELLSNARGRGLFCAIDFPNGEIRHSFINKCFENCLLILPCGEKSVRFRPPLNLSKSELDEGMSVIKSCLNML